MTFHRLALIGALAVVLASAQTGLKRPGIVGVAHIGLKTNDLAAARNFYGRDLGFQEPFTLDKATTQLRDYLASRGVKVPGALKAGLDANVSVMTLECFCRRRESPTA